jgi:hypothetical protein
VTLLDSVGEWLVFSIIRHPGLAPPDRRSQPPHLGRDGCRRHPRSSPRLIESRMIRAMKLVAILFAAVFGLAGCSHDSTVHVHGVISTSNNSFRVPGEIGGPKYCPRYEILSKYPQSTFLDGSGKVIGTTLLTHPSSYPTLVPTTSDCPSSATYDIDLPKVDFYQVRIAGVDKQAEPISYESIQKDGFELDLTVG